MASTPVDTKGAPLNLSVGYPWYQPNLPANLATPEASIFPSLFPSSSYGTSPPNIFTSYNPIDPLAALGYAPSNPGNPFNPFPEFSADATPTSSIGGAGTSGLAGALGGTLPPPDITGYTYGDYATPNYQVAAGAPTPNVVPGVNNPINQGMTPSAGTTSGMTWIIYGGIALAVIGIGYFVDKKLKKRKDGKKRG